MLKNEVILDNHDILIIIQDAYVNGYLKAKETSCDYQEQGWEYAKVKLKEVHNDN